MSQPNRTDAGGRIDRGRPLRFQFDGRGYQGYAGDTLASALLANDVHLVGRSFKYHRPRGILALGAEEPNALVQLEEGALTEPNARATQVALYEGLSARSQNRWPTAAFDIGALNDRLSPLIPAGFYYKTFMWPAGLWMGYEKLIRRMAGIGRAPEAPDPERYDRMHAHCDVLVVGAGPAGLAAALAAARTGARVILADEQTEAGGQLLAERFDIDGRPAAVWVSAVMAELAVAAAEVQVLDRTLVSGYYDHNFLVGCQRFDHSRAASGAPRQRLWKIRAREVVLATGAIERALVFPDNDRPGIMLAGAVRGYLNRYGVRAGARVALATVCDDAYRTALALAAAGVDVVAAVDARPSPSGFLPQQAAARGIEILAGHRLVGARGRKRVRSVLVQPLAGGAVREIGCDLVAISGGWIPAVHLFSQSRGRLHFDAAVGAVVPAEATQPVRCAGSMRACWSLAETLAQGFAAGAAAAHACGFGDGRAPSAPRASEPEEAASEPAHAHRPAASRRKQFVDFQSDVTAADVALAAREGYEAIEHLKRYTTAGMGVDQGKTGNANVVALLAEVRGEQPAAIGTTTYRPPYQPVTFGAIAGMDAGPLFDPVRKTPLHEWHERHGARFEDVGQWQRAWYYPRDGEDMHAAVRRECLTVRGGVGLLDASTLGKIDVQGPDAAEFLDRIYCNRVGTLANGRCRYGIMLGQDGMVFDDGVIARLSERHFVVTTTTGGAARVLGWLEEWLQTEWPTLAVYCTSVTEHYAQIALSGPASAEVLAPLCSIDVRAMPAMAVRAAEVAGIAGRIFRLSFAGGPGYEIAVPAARGYELWTTLMGAGERFGIAPYGTEAMHVLRAEKGFIIVGQETDGSVTPFDLGFDRLVATDKFFVGKRSLRRPDLQRTNRRQLVGLLTEDPQQVLPEGAQVVAEPRALEPAPKEPVPMLGYVTSSYFSPTCGRSIALALVEAGIARLGETLYAPLASGCAKVTLTAPRFVGDAGEALHG